MTRLPRARLLARALPGAAVALAVYLSSLGVLADSVSAGDKATGRIDLEASLEPADLAPGGSGTLIIRATLLNKEHDLEHYIYAAGEKALTWTPLAAPGVTYDVAGATLSPPMAVEDEGSTYQAWMNEFELRVPVTLGPDTAPSTQVGAALTYSGCIKSTGCYAPVKDHKVSVALPGGAGGGVLADSTPVGSTVGIDVANGGTASIDYDEDKGEVIVTFVPAFLHHMYGPGTTEPGTVPIGVEPVASEGVTWGPVAIEADDVIEMPVSVRVPVTKTDAVRELAVRVTFSACDDAGCKGPVQGERLTLRWPGAKAAPEEAPKGADAQKTGGLLFPVIEGDTLDKSLAPVADDAGAVQAAAEESLLLAMGLLFLMGIGLAFTPCVLPIIPITVSVITGGNADIPKQRLSALLLTYVAGLSLAFATMGTIAAGVGGSLSAAFAMPGVQWSIAILFIGLAFSMIGVYELQPPAWLMKLQGGAQKRSGSLIGAFMFGILGAIIASPCTAPAVAGALIVVAKTGSLAIGFWMFFAFGLGMGTVFFAAGALNFLARPGPWMVWVRYTFGMLLFGVALYYLYSGGLVSTPVLWIMGLVITVLAVVGVAWHLRTKEYEEPARARRRGLEVGAMWLAALVLVAILGSHQSGEWVYVKDRAHLAQLVKEANAEGKPVVVDFWAEWCHYCKEYDKLIEGDEDLKAQFERVAKLKVDLTDDAERWDLRHAVGLTLPAQPYMVFIDREGRIRKGADVTQWNGDGEAGIAQLRARLAVVLGGETTEAKPVEAGATPGTKSDTEPGAPR
ncbi:MAG: sulfite exporter TauE/SafE family protein [Planctomycetota bacterium]|nr:sulfite exporter TauE/SafE family protein [Planctomycetota bacterium]